MIVDAVREFLSRSEQLFEVAETARHGFPAARRSMIFVPGDQVNQADMAEVVGHLVDEVRLAGHDSQVSAR